MSEKPIEGCVNPLNRETHSNSQRKISKPLISKLKGANIIVEESALICDTCRKKVATMVILEQPVERSPAELSQCSSVGKSSNSTIDQVPL